MSTVTESLPVEDVAEQFSAHEEEEFGDDPLHCEDPVMHISGTGHWFLEGWIGDHSAGGCTGGYTSGYSTDVAQREWNWH